ncbi:exopolyphosphatase [Phyllobacterium phragmitis]|uniref:Exopolyphosphatase n=1 Tax=Phyllobacterium phragmitis TaxID=2670329 RepID=A0A2S9IR45_9HYPH|nr:Ppx/GppA phosphatase family protein [Phyllobacterium phragmitis]PRD42998.1 exopolyphosphatase [Phyllobacterium phragmitis]
MKNPEEDAGTASHDGASGGNWAHNDARNSTENGRRENRQPKTASAEPQQASDSGRLDTNQKKRARRRRRGKAKLRDKASQGGALQAEAIAIVLPHADAQPAAPATPSNTKPASKLSNRRRRSKRNKQARSQTASSPAAEKQAVQGATPRPQQEQPRPRPFSARTDAPPLYAALDLGTNNCRLLVASPTRPGQFRVVDAFSRIVRLGEGLGATGRLGDNAMNRAVEALKICRDKLASKTVRRSRLIATEACRSADNGAEFLARVRDETGLDLEIVDRQTEARLAVSGCGTLVDHGTDAIVLFDIGGGSSEIALIDVSRRRSPRLAEHIIAWTSLPVGVVTLAERFGGREVTRESFATMVGHVSELIESFTDRHKLGELTKSPRFHLIGTSGTVTTLAGIHLGLERYDRKRIDGMWMDKDDVTSMTSRLLSWDFDARVANPCIGADRADLVLAGCAILDAIRNVWPSQKLRVADRGLREGILTELMSRDGAWRDRRHPRANGRRIS